MRNTKVSAVDAGFKVPPKEFGDPPSIFVLK
jgi:hypothetical protein